MRRRHTPAVLEVLDAERHAGEPAGVLALGHSLVDVLGGGARRIGIQVHEGVELTVAGGDGVEALVEDLGRLQLPGPDGFGDLDDGAHGRSH